MSDRPWTPGPWKVHLVDETLVTGKKADISTTFFGDAANAEERASNARLIASAPDMYEALDRIITQWDTPNWKLNEKTGAIINDARAVLRKARGEE